MACFGQDVKYIISVHMNHPFIYFIFIFLFIACPIFMNPCSILLKIVKESYEPTTLCNVVIFDKHIYAFFSNFCVTIYVVIHHHIFQQLLILFYFSCRSLQFLLP